MSVFNIFKYSRFFLWINIVGLTIGLAASILLILFVINELSYDKHFANSDRIVRLITISEREDETKNYPINLWKAYTEVQGKVPGVEATVQIYDPGVMEVKAGEQLFQNIRTFAVNPDFFSVFQMKFIEGSPNTVLEQENAAVITQSTAERMFGSPEAAINQTIFAEDRVVTGVVKDLPKNTHFHFDILVNINSLRWGSYSFLEIATGLEFFTFYLINENASMEATREAIEKAYQPSIDTWSGYIGSKAWGKTELLKDVYLNSRADESLGTTGSMQFIYILSGLAFFILILAITNFINLFVTQGEIRMKEIAIRKSNGAQISDIIRQFFSEIALVVFIAFVIGIILAVVCAPYFAELIHKTIDLNQLLNPTFILSIVLLFIVTVCISAVYPAFYLSRFSPLKIFTKQIAFSKKRLNAIIVVFQSVISIFLLVFILALFKQIAYLQKLPAGYNPHQVVTLVVNQSMASEYNAIKQELLKNPAIEKVAGSHHTFGKGSSGQVIAPMGEREKVIPIKEYRVMTDFCELYELELTEGKFFSENEPDSLQILILNESAVKALGGKSPVEEMFIANRNAKVIGVVKDFYYDDPMNAVAPIMLTKVNNAGIYNIKLASHISRSEAEMIIQEIIRKFDSSFTINPVWSEDIYQSKFGEIKSFTTVVLIGSVLSIFITMLGLLALHLYNTVRRTKEIAIRRINGAEKKSIFGLLSTDILKWILIAAIIALPIAGYFLVDILNNYTNHISIGWSLFLLPVLTQVIIALLTTSGVTLWTLSRNPVEAIKSE